VARKNKSLLISEANRREKGSQGSGKETTLKDLSRHGRRKGEAVAKSTPFLRCPERPSALLG